MLKIVIHKSFNASYHFSLVKFWWKIAKKPNATEIFDMVRTQILCGIHSFFIRIQVNWVEAQYA